MLMSEAMGLVDGIPAPQLYKKKKNPKV